MDYFKKNPFFYSIMSNYYDIMTKLSDVIKNEALNNSEKLYLIEDFDKVFSIELTADDALKNSSDVDEEDIQKLIQERNDARNQKNWARVDEIRKMLLEKNIELVDTKEGTTWRIK